MNKQKFRAIVTLIKKDGTSVTVDDNICLLDLGLRGEDSIFQTKEQIKKIMREDKRLHCSLKDFKSFHARLRKVGQNSA